MRVSVIITTCDRAGLLLEALQSVLAQSRPADEIIVVDDGSADNTRDALAPYRERIRMLHHEKPLGVSAARNRGIAAATGEWLAFLDSDDLWMPQKLALQTAALHNQPEYLICYTDEEWRRHGRWMNQGKRHAKYAGWIYHHCLPLCIISPSSILLHRQVLEKVGLFDPGLPACEDYDLWLRMTWQYPVLFLPQRLIIKRAGDWPQLSRQHGLDRYRIIALAKMLTVKGLPESDRAPTRTLLQEKCRIYALGCRKYGKEEEAAWAETLCDRLLK